MNTFDLVGTPFNELNCFELVIKCYEIEQGIKIAPVRVPEDRMGMIFKHFLQEVNSNWQPCDQKAGVCVAMKFDASRPRLVTHFGYMISNDKVLHTTRETNAIIQDIELLRGLVYGFYDYKGLV